PQQQPAGFHHQVAATGGAAAAYGHPLFQQDDKENTSASTPRTQQHHFQSRLFGQQQQGAAAGPPAAGGPGGPAEQVGLQGLQGQQGQRGLQHPGLQQQDNGVLELEPHGVAKQPQPDRPDSQMFHSTGVDHSLYALDWSYPRARGAPTSLVLKRWGGLSPPEYVAVYRLRGPGPGAGPGPGGDPSAAPSYTLAHDELRHYPWDVSRRHGPPRWRGGAPRDEDFELLPAGYGLGHHGHGAGNHQYMYRT
ncbi:Rap guanine nucleotide exchange factor 2, partial [Frankliniella fusca]